MTGEPVTHRHVGAESLILAEARITYRAQAFYGEVITVQTRATRIGRSSFTLEHRLLAAEPDAAARLVAVSDSVLVRYDYAAASPAALSGDQSPRSRRTRAAGCAARLRSRGRSSPRSGHRSRSR